MEIKEYCEQLKQLCEICRKKNKCKDHTKICMLKKYTWMLAVKRYEKEGTKEDGNR